MLKINVKINLFYPSQNLELKFVVQPKGLVTILAYQSLYLDKGTIDKK